VALALRMSGFSADDVSAALSGAKFPKDEIAGALAYAGYKH